MKRKIKVRKLIADLFGMSIGLVSCFFMILMTFSFVMFGKTLFYEPNLVISIIEFSLAILGTTYFCYRVIKLMTKRSFDEYLIKT